MLYLNEELLQAAGRDWNALINTIKEAVFILDAEDYAQPIKPYLKYGDPKNRIIAMPAFAGGHISLSGIKWIASFPGNLKANLPRAHSVTILNEASTGVPVCIINTTLISEIRTAAVTAAILEQYIRSRSKTDYHIAIFGFGPIGKMHLEMVTNIVAEKVGKVSLFDPRGIREDDLTNYDETVVVANSWNEIYDTADIVITCTNSSVPFIDRKPKPGSVQLNVSLRDYFPEIINYVKTMVIDSWEEVCRENTNVEMMHLKYGLKKEDTISMQDVIIRHAFNHTNDDEVVMFNPMGMALFDIAIAAYYYHLSAEKALALKL